MGSIVSALTGGGAEDAADAQAASLKKAIAAQKEYYNLAYGNLSDAMRLQEGVYDDVLAMSRPYRDAGAQALSVYESMLYGIPIDQTSSYKSVQRQIAQEGYQTPYDLIPEGAVQKEPGIWSLPGTEDQFRVEGDSVFKRTGEGDWADFATAAAKPDQTSLLPADIFGLSASGSGEPGTMDPRMSALIQTPGYQFRMDEGQKALERSAAARSGLLSGATLKATDRYAQDYASGEFSNFMNRVGALASQGANMTQLTGNQALSAGSAQAGTLGSMANLATQTGENIGSLQGAMGSARASGYLGQQSTGTSLLNTVFGAAGAAGGFGSLFSGIGSLFSDRRLKENVTHLGVENGHNVYAFNYIGNKKRFIGVMADEVEKTNPEAVTEIQGYKAVNYNQIGVKFRRA